MSDRRVYLDHASGMPVDPRVVDAMIPYFTEHFGNPSSLHGHGSGPRAGILDARRAVAELVKAHQDDVIFTSGATESNNLAILGAASGAEGSGHIISSMIEHFSILNPLAHLRKCGFDVTLLPVDGDALVDPQKLQDALTGETILITMGLANGEVGTVQNIGEISKLARDADIPLHIDAVPAAGLVPIDVTAMGIDMLTISSNDMYGPKGVGALVFGKGARGHVRPIVHGGGHERGLRAGSENTPGIIGLGKAAELAVLEMESNAAHIRALRDMLIKGVQDSIRDATLNGHPVRRLPNNANMRFKYVEGEGLLLNLDMEGISVSTSSACTSKTLEASHVLMAMGVSHAEAHGALQFILSKFNSKEDIEHVIVHLPTIVDRLRAMSPLTPKGYLEDQLDIDSI